MNLHLQILYSVEAEQYNNPVFSSDLRDHIDRRNSVVEVSV